MGPILIIEDDKNLLNIVDTYLKNEGFETIKASNGKDGLTYFNEGNPSMVLLDIMLPDMDGKSILKEIREGSDVPVLMMTARGEEYDRLLGFELGADDYIVKPFSPKELVARCRAILRRVYPEATDRNLTFKGIEIDEVSREAYVDGRHLDLTPKEFELLKYLTVNRGKALSREKILNAVWGYDFYGDLRTVDTHIKQLREKLGDKKSLIKTVWGIGYKLEE
ncbi:response regulator transcription factor [Calorimonas adulescens]|jgi:Transcriptional regulatory protein, C terminal./Response regulator receiver domain.|uniref:Stage 0 sporulation protein A homolog n=1 Tax=Calorimonas adulescens TaxID=2606906 RepID=A0A5D8Q8N1_9THEO|nr:response regulator transcription factor [Calorimonas adulescens]TZE80842.1 response regulator transcription factor [Calorimonas adulescens]